MEIKNAADQDRAYKAEFPELPMQWKNYGYEITEKLGEGISGSVYKLVKNKGEADEEISALKMISWTLNKKMVYREYGNDWVKARRDFTQFFNDKVAHEVSRLDLLQGQKILCRSREAAWKRCRRRISGNFIFRWSIWKISRNTSEKITWKKMKQWMRKK